ncbi:hypothetical protein [Moritella viscosa]|uniref:hypothetical protein n=1 Tax=Moritella viscosa TaxID=80854 RepID=UPI0009218AC5|nr:hypothetical protein [Moritella viscosa]SGZ09141.1 Putative uncharacterized protein [Moritella viscosa]
MKILFVDAENVGFKGLDAIDANIIDKVFIFSRVDSIKLYSEQKLYLCLSDYPEGANQADFYIISYLSRVLTTVSKNEKQAIEFILYSDDLNLVNAFKFQCDLFGAKSRIESFNQRAKTSNIVCHIVKEPNSDLIETQIFNMLDEPTGLFYIQESLNIPLQTFTKAVNTLVKSNKICRSSKNDKHWVQC